MVGTKVETEDGSIADALVLDIRDDDDDDSVNLASFCVPVLKVENDDVLSSTWQHAL